MTEMQTNEGEQSRMSRLLWVVLVLIAVGGAGDLLMDAPRRWLSLHTLFELTLTAASVVGVVAFWLGWWNARASARDLERTLERQTAERDAWRRSAETALEGLARAMDMQFDAWKLTAAEREVALYVLKGHSHKRIARVTGRSERTVRQHAAAVYEKAGLGGRAELAAFFLEDIILPAGEREITPAGGS
jgi:DNA-binding CsgD family transcriptional regulator